MNSKFKKYYLPLAILFAGLPSITPTVIAEPSPASTVTPPSSTSMNNTPTPPKSSYSPDTELAKIGNTKITGADLDAEFSRKPPLQMRKQMLASDPASLKKLERAALEGLIGREILLQEAVKSGNANEALLKSQVEQVVANYGGESKLPELLKQVGATPEQFKKDVANDFRIKNYIDEKIAKEIAVSDQEIKARFDLKPDQYAKPESVRARHILIKVGPDATPAEVDEAQKKIQALYLDVKEPNADFAKVALENSQCPSAAQGGDLGEFGKGMMVKEFEEVAFGLQVGEISKPLRTQFGFHVIKLDKKIAAAPANFETAKPAIADQLKMERASEKVKEKIGVLRKQEADAGKLSINEKVFE